MENPDRPVIVVQSIAGDDPPEELFPGKQPIYVEPGFLVYFDFALGLAVRRFNPKTLKYGDAENFGSDMLLTSTIGGVQFRVSDNGTLIYVQGEVAETAAAIGYGLSVVDVSGDGNFVDVSALPAVSNRYRFPRVSADGNLVALEVNLFSESSQIYLYDIGSGGSEPRQLTFEGNNSRPVISTDGQWVAFASDRGGDQAIWRKSTDFRGDAIRLTTPAEGQVHEQPAFTADGKKLAYSVDDGNGEVDIWITTLADGTAEPLVELPGIQSGIAFSPDGNAMAYWSGAISDAAIIVEPYPKESGRGTIVSEDGVCAYWPIWSRDSSRIFYQLCSSGTFGSVDFDTSNSFALSNRKALPFGRDQVNRHADSMPDGRLLVTVPVGTAGAQVAASRQIVIVENWIEELERRVPEFAR